MRVLFLVLALCSSSLYSVKPKDIAVVSMAVGDEYQKIVALGTQSRVEYCKKHGYAFINSTRIQDPLRPIPWSKIPLLLKLMDECPQYKWIFWSDADSIIMNSDISLEQFVDEDYEMIICFTIDMVNTGQFIIRNSEWSRRFLEAIYAHDEDIYHKWWENLALLKELENPEWSSRTKVVPGRTFNSMTPDFLPGREDHTYGPGDFIIHFAGARGDYLKSLFEKYFALRR